MLWQQLKLPPIFACQHMVLASKYAGMATKLSKSSANANVSPGPPRQGSNKGNMSKILSESGSVAANISSLLKVKSGGRIIQARHSQPI
jgi:hypothetical protein